MTDSYNETIYTNFRDYFEDHLESIQEFANNPSRETYYIDLERLEQYDQTFFQDTLIQEPDKALENAKEAFGDVAENDSFRLRLENPPERYKTGIREIRTDHINQLLFIEGTIAKSTDVQPKIDVATFECPDCGATIERVISDEEISVEPTAADCPNSSDKGHSSSSSMKMDLVMQNSKMEDYQRMRVQESPEDMDGDNPKNVDVTITGDDVAGVAMAGQKVVVSGILRVTQREPKSAILDRHIEGVNVELDEATTEDIDVTEEDVERIKELAQKPDIYTKLAKSIEPTIYGYETERMGATLQLFSGVTKKFSNAGDIRGNIHVLYVGDPGTGKSRILKFVSDLSPTGGVFTSGKGSSSAGITAAAVKDKEFGGDDKWTLKAGALVMADQGIACVDELDKMKENDRSALHEGLEQQQISISKAGINATLNARCSLLAAANPKHGRFDEHGIIPEQIDLEPALISRFDLIFIITDNPNEEKDSNIANQILDNNVTGQENVQRRQRELENSDVESEEELYIEEEEEGEIDAPISKEMFQKYIAYAKENFHPKLTDDARDLIREKYVSIRQEGKERDVISLTARALEAIVRLTEAAARIKLSDEATVEHARKAIEVYEAYLKQVGVDPETGKYDADALESGTTGSQRSRITAIEEVIDRLQDSEEKDPTEEAIIEELEGEFEKSRIEKSIGKLSRKGDIYEDGSDDGKPIYDTV